MTVRAKLGLTGALALLPLLTAAAVMSSKVGVVLLLGPLAIVLAFRSVAFPVALGGLPTLAIALLNHNPFPHGLVTVVLFGWMALAIVLALMTHEGELPARVVLAGPLVFSLLLGAALVTRLSASSAGAYGSTKVKLFVLENVALAVAGILVAQKKRHLDRFVWATLVVAGLTALLLLWRLAQGNAQALYADRFTISSEENPIQLGRASADGLLIATCILVAGARSSTRSLATVVIPVLVISLLAAGSRGPVLGALGGLITVFVVLARDRALKRRLLRVGLAAAAAAVLASAVVPGNSIQRSLLLFSDTGSGLSSNGRFRLWSEAYGLFAAHPLFGIGTGSFFGVDGLNEYPHNLLLEVACELGVVGLVLLFAFLGSSWLALLRARARLERLGAERYQVAIVMALFVSAFVNAMFSGDIETNSGIWLAAGLGVGLTMRGPEDGGLLDEQIDGGLAEVGNDAAEGPT